MGAARTEQNLNKAARAERDQLALWLEDHEERLEKLEQENRQLRTLVATLVSKELADSLAEGEDRSDDSGVHPSY